MKSDLLRYKTEFALDEVARLWAGVEVETPENRENVISALRILLRAIEKLRLFANGPDSIADVPLLTASGDYNWDSPWRYVLVSRQALEDWFARERQPPPKWLALEALEEEIAQEEGQLASSSLAPEAGSSALPRQKKRAGHSQEALMRIIAALVVMLIEVDKGKSLVFGGKLNKPNKSALFEKIHNALEHMDAPVEGAKYSQFADILTDEFYDDIVNALNK